MKEREGHGERRGVGWGLFVLRLVVGGLFLAHGVQKLFNVWGGFGADDASKLLSAVGAGGVPTLRLVIGGIEFLGGSLLLLGLFARLTSLPLLIYTGSLLYLLVRDQGDFLLRAGAPCAGEHYAAIIACLLAILLAGPGRLSLDGQLYKS